MRFARKLKFPSEPLFLSRAPKEKDLTHGPPQAPIRSGRKTIGSSAARLPPSSGASRYKVFVRATIKITRGDKAPRLHPFRIKTAGSSKTLQFSQKSGSDKNSRQIFPARNFPAKIWKQLIFCSSPLFEPGLRKTTGAYGRFSYIRRTFQQQLCSVCIESSHRSDSPPSYFAPRYCYSLFRHLYFSSVYLSLIVFACLYRVNSRRLVQFTTLLLILNTARKTLQ